MIDARRAAEVKEERHDLFSNLLDANEIEHDSGAKLSNEELIGRFRRVPTHSVSLTVITYLRRECVPVPGGWL